jgi:hypothetical protein
MSTSIAHKGNIPDTIFIVSSVDDNVFWIYLKEGHALNRLLKERKGGKSVTLVKFSESEQNS